MTFLQETPLHNNNKSEFIFALSNVFNAMEQNIRGKLDYNHAITFDDIPMDKLNVNKLKKELGITLAEKQMLRIMTKTNEMGQNGIRNKYNNSKYEEFVKLNNFATIFFL